MIKKRVTVRQLAVLKFILQYQKQYKRGPTLTEIGEFLKCSSANQAARGHLLRMEKKGIILRNKGAHREIKFLCKLNQVVIKQWNAAK